MPKLRLTDADYDIICNALLLAAERYDEHASTLGSMPEHKRLAEQFKRQAREAREVQERIDGRE